MRILLPILCVFVAIGVFLGGGCETEPASSPIHISPSSATIRYRQSVQLAASGGYDYAWTLSDYGLGTLSVNTGPSTIYTSIVEPTSQSIQVVTVTLTIGGSATGVSSNAAPYSATAEARIVHLGSTSTPTTTATTTTTSATTATTTTTTIPPATALSLSSTAASLASNGATATLTAAGGTSPYTFTVANTARGNISGVGSSRIYTRNSAGANMITVTDSSSAHATASVTIQQP